MTEMAKALSKEIEKNEQLENQLEKAKKLIRSLINACCSYGATGKPTADAESFLKELEK